MMFLQIELKIQEVRCEKFFFYSKLGRTKRLCKILEHTHFLTVGKTTCIEKVMLN